MPQLIPDTLRLIFSHLPLEDLLSGRLPRVCKSWAQVLADPKFMKRRCEIIPDAPLLIRDLGPNPDLLDLSKWKERLFYSQVEKDPLLQAGRPKDLVLMLLTSPLGTGSSFLSTSVFMYNTQEKIIQSRKAWFRVSPGVLLIQSVSAP